MMKTEFTANQRRVLHACYDLLLRVKLGDEIEIDVKIPAEESRGTVDVPESEDER